MLKILRKYTITIIILYYCNIQKLILSFGKNNNIGECNIIKNNKGEFKEIRKLKK